MKDNIGCSLATITLVAMLGVVVWMFKDVLFGIGYH